MKGLNRIRRVLCIVFIVALLAVTAAPAFAASNKNPGGAYIVTASRLNMRSGANGSIVRKLPKGTVVVYRSQSKGWWRVMCATGTGYVDRRWLTSVNGYVGGNFATTVNLYVRSKASETSYALGKLKKGTKVKLIKQKGTWMQISYKGRTGWVASKYLKKA